MENLIVPDGLVDVKPIREIIYDYLRQAILNGVIKPGDRLIERDIAVRFKASRTPVRDALRKLETEGLIEYLTRKGMVVRGFNTSEFVETYKIRSVLERLAVRGCIENITETGIAELRVIVERLEKEENDDGGQYTYKELKDFDDLILETANMPILKGFLQVLKESIQRYRKINLSHRPRRKDAVREHKEILLAIIDRNVELAEVLVAQHIENARAEFLRHVK